VNDAPIPPRWPALPAERRPEQLRTFLREASDRLHPSSDATSEERAWLSGALVGLAEWLLEQLEKPQV
jgi:hypothetical protein